MEFYLYLTSEFSQAVVQCDLRAFREHARRYVAHEVNIFTDLHRLLYEERLQLPGLHCLQWRWMWANLFIAFKVSTDLLDVDSTFFPFLSQRGHSYKVLQGKSHGQRRRLV